jgi:hypothetical protein
VSNSATPATASSSGEVTPPTPFWKLCRLLGARATAEAENSFDESSIDAILMAETEEEMWDADERGPLGGRDLEGVLQIIEQVEIKFSRDAGLSTPFKDPETGKGFYLILTSVRTHFEKKYRPDIGEGQKFVWNTSAPRVVAKIFWLESRGLLDGKRVYIDAVDLGAGQAVLKLKTDK